MIDLLLVATRYGVTGAANNWPRRLTFERGAFAAHLGRRPIALQVEHHGEAIFGECKSYDDRRDELRLVMHTRDPAIVAPLSRGFAFVGGCSVGTHLFDSQIVEDEHGELERVFDAEVYEVSLTRSPGIAGSRLLAWRWAA